jgi:hypothetical protein
MNEIDFDAMVAALVQEMFKVTRFDARKMSPKAGSVVAAAAIEFLIVAVAALPARHRALAVKGLRKNLTKRVAAMSAALEED